MFNKPTVFIVGVGASEEFGMPLGGGLKTNIARRIRSVDDLPGRALFDQMIKSLGEDRAEQLARLGLQLSEVIPRFNSMDEVLHFLSHDEDIVLLGKIAISYEILVAEQGSHLFSHFNLGCALERLERDLISLRDDLGVRAIPGISQSQTCCRRPRWIGR
jgi:hypothetical protein